MPRADGSFSAFVTETLRLSSFVQIFVRSLAPSLANSVCMGSGGLAARHVPPPLHRYSSQEEGNPEKLTIERIWSHMTHEPSWGTSVR